MPALEREVQFAALRRSVRTHCAVARLLKTVRHTGKPGGRTFLQLFYHFGAMTFDGLHGDAQIVRAGRFSGFWRSGEVVH
jgi:hypothetical protein